MATGTMLDIKIHVDGDSCYLDSFTRVFFNYSGTPFADGDSIVVKEDVSNSPNDAYRVKFLYTEGNDPGNGMARFQMLDNARTAINDTLGEDLFGLTKVA